jgi:hypothetical protein
MTPSKTIDRSKNWSYIPRVLSVHGAIDETLLRRVAEGGPPDSTQTIAAVLNWAAELVTPGLRLPALQRYVYDPTAAGDVAVTEQSRRERADSVEWRAAAANELRELAAMARSGTMPESLDQSPREACRFAEHVLRQRHIVSLVEHARRNPDSVHSALPEADNQRVRDLMLGTTWQWPDLDDTIARWRNTVDKLGVWGYDEFAHFLSARDDLAAAEQACSPEAAGRLRARYASIDRRYLDLTTPIDHAIHDGPGRWSPRGWWRYRAPRDLDVDFARSAGLQCTDIPSSDAR